MTKTDKFSRILLSIAALFLAWTSDAAAATLYERSLEKFQVRSEQASPADFTFVVLGDSRGNDGVFKKALALAGGYNPLFILHGGDYSDHGSDRETDHFLAMVHDGVPEAPLFVVLGNHEKQRKVFAEKIGPSNFTLDSARLKLRVIALDNADYALKIPELNDLHRQLAAKRENTFVAMHIPPKTERWSWHTFSDGAEELVNALAENGVRAAFYFHVHLYDRDEIKGVLSIITAGAGAPLTKFGFPGEPVYHIVVVRVKNGAVTTENALEAYAVALGPGMRAFGAIVGLLTIGSIFFMVAEQVKDTLTFDFFLHKRAAWFLALTVPTALFVFGVRDFISVISFTGSV